jgi:oligopeptide/dipeptide ABC transporter ATP-binding protein
VTAPAPLLAVEGLTKHFPVMDGFIVKRQVATVRAVDEVSFAVGVGETLGLVGESGCGKSTTGRMLVRLYKPTRGRILFDGVDIAGAEGQALRDIRRDIQIIFQDPYGALNPRMSVAQILREPLEIHGQATREAADRRVRDLLDMVGLARSHAERYPHEFSGGQRQRIGIARALALKPRLVVCDEPVSALDVSVQAQIVNLLQDLQRDQNLAFVFIAHDLGVVKHISDRVAVMYLGRIVEIASKDRLYADPKHPYTQALLASIPVAKPRARRARAPLSGEIPSPLNPPPGCHFNTRCPHASEVCRAVAPPMIEVGAGQRVACHLFADASRAAA